MKRTQLRIGHRTFGKTDFPQSLEPWFMLSALPKDTSSFETPADRDLADRLDAAEYSQTATLRVHLDGFDATFHTWRKYRYLIWVFGQPNMPRGHRLTGKAELGTAGNRHWLSRLPAPMKRWAFRRRVIDHLTGTQPLIRRYIDWHLAQGATRPEDILQTS